MYATIKKLLPTLITIYVIALSCNVHNDFNNCEIYLEFIFDYNMEFADSFDPQVPTVDVYIFDDNDKYVLHKHADSANDLIGGKQMNLSNELPLGTYKIITIGGLSKHFRFTGVDNNDLVVGVTTIQQVKLALSRQSNESSYDFDHLWFGETTEITYQTTHSVWPIHLIRNTNNFHVVFNNVVENNTPDKDIILYTFEIVTPEGAIYDSENNPLTRETLTYLPFNLEQVEERENILVGKINTMRLFANHPDGYRLIVRDTETSDEVLNFDLMLLFGNTKPSRPDGTRLSLQEYLDREAEWDIVIISHKPLLSGGSFVALRIIVNGWIVHENDIGV